MFIVCIVFSSARLTEGHWEPWLTDVCMHCNFIPANQKRLHLVGWGVCWHYNSREDDEEGLILQKMDEEMMKIRTAFPSVFWGTKEPLTPSFYRWFGDHTTLEGWWCAYMEHLFRNKHLEKGCLLPSTDNTIHSCTTLWLGHLLAISGWLRTVQEV